MNTILRFSWAVALIFLVMAPSTMTGCKESDINLIRKSSYGNSENSIAFMFDHCDLFLSQSWSSKTSSSGQHYVVFVAELPKDRLLKAASVDSPKWLSVEKKYSRIVFPQVRRAYIVISFLITSPETFELGRVSLGVSSDKKTAWSSDLRKSEKQDIMICIYRNSPALITILGRYGNPSFREGSNMYAELIGKKIDVL
jgi:hypothetical protein